MEFTIKKSDIERSLQLLQGVVETKITMPILANILIDAVDGGLRLRATDLDVGLETFAECEVKSHGSTSVAVKKLYDIVKSLPDGDIQFEKTAESGVVLKGGTSRLRLVDMPVVDFPHLPVFPEDRVVKISAALLSDMFEKIAFNIAPDDLPQHKGTLFVVRPDSLTLVATDGHRLTHIRKTGESMQLPDDIEEYRVLLSKKAIHTIQRIEADGDIEFALGENHVFFRMGSKTLSSRLMEMKFPKYEKVIPRDNDRLLKVSVGQLLPAVRTATLFTSDRLRPTLLGLSEEGVTVTALSAEIGEGRVLVPGEYTGEKMEIRFNGQYLIDFLQAAGTEDVRIEMKDPERATLVRPAGPTPYEYFHVLMPIKM
ncbi:MAG: DNA polymerase III subunit beta [Acidobacteriota bacterium]